MYLPVSFLANLGLSDTLKIADIVGIPLPWPQATPPAGWLKCNGQAFDKNAFPKLAQVYPGGVLPDLRGEFIRGWDDGRGVDAGRAVGSNQSDAFKSHSHRFVNEYNSPSTTFIAFTDQNSEGVDGSLRSGNRAWTYVYMENSGENETRPRNIAFSYIVKAA
ncbi:phage tail protein [Dickeya oryzae]|uniref:tail fiber protein n=1 Tax=Dickeya oryzae TaxID=1240404 RepID=UPI0020985FB9|nr:tail fiber protein [Dickeya oryzae]MCO7254407.1 phage tail protein [Dickeya oryzae]